MTPTTRMDREVSLMWSIWKSRNSMLFRSETPIPESTLIRAKKANAEWRIRLELTHPLHSPFPNQSSGRRRKTHWVAWRKPQRESIKINFDGSKTFHGAGGGFIIRNWEGRFIQAASFSLGGASVLVAEATAMRNGIKAALQAGFTDIHIEGDNKILIQAVQGHIQVPWEIQVLIQDIHTFLQHCNTVIVTHIFRQGNRAANWLAKYGVSLLSTMVWNVVPHRDLSLILYEDNLGRPLERRAK